MLFGNSERMRAIGEIVARIADTDVPVLITGESGTGKELVAHAVHRHSARSNNVFVKVNCAAIPGELMESELFGYEKGGFTGADRDKPGRFEFADKGVIFLDEIAETPLSLQSKLLRILQDGEFFRIGGKKEIRVDTRIIASSNRNLEQMLRERKFREDLFYRLNVIRIDVPPLRERREEILPLTDYFLGKYSSTYARPVKILSKKTRELLLRYAWPGNVRELENTIRKIVLVDDDESLEKLLTPREDKIATTGPVEIDYEGCSLKTIAKKAALDAERRVIKDVLDKTRWNRSQAAKILRISYKTLLYKIKATGLEDSFE
ncbi:MAG: sigma-54-dependent Fis family transcriptional regulator [Deltaproteobacteria bacterium]|nr:sigma-54-dependent Fis family transcriptional regulator [Deltaproteobacteria bacterium]